MTTGRCAAIEKKAADGENKGSLTCSEPRRLTNQRSGRSEETGTIHNLWAYTCLVFSMEMIPTCR